MENRFLCRGKRTDKVVQQLEGFREEMDQFKCSGMLSDMIEVVKAGGVE